MSFFEELKRRKVIRVAILYAAFAYAATEVTGVLQPALLLPDWTIRLVVLLLLIGAPIALILAWIFDVSPTSAIDRTGEDAAEGDHDVRGPAVTPATVVVAVLLVGTGLAAGLVLGGEGAGDGEASAEAGLGQTAALASVAVLPFDDLSPNGDQRWFVDGIAEEILNTLSRIPELKVPARTTSFAYGQRGLDPRAIGDSLGVGALLEGSLRKDGDAIRIGVQLIDADDGTQVWSESYDERSGSLFEIQESIARQIVTELRVPLGLGEERLVSQRTDDVDAYETYLRARELFRQRGPGLDSALVLLDRVVAQDSAFAPAWALIAEILPILNNFAFIDDIDASEERIRRAQAAADRAIAIDSTYAPGWGALGTVSRERLDWDGAVRYLERALALDPNYAEAHSNLGEALSALGRYDEARPHHLRALDADPQNTVYMLNMYWLAYPGASEEALRYARRAAETTATGDPWFYVVLYLAALGRHDEARTELARSTLGTGNRERMAVILEDMAADRQTDEGERALESLDLSLAGVLPETWLVYGDAQRAAREALDIAWERPYMWAGYLVGLEALRGNPDYEEARRRRGLPPLQ